jgi:hypothetical protein
MSRRIYTIRFILADWLSAVIAWGLFYIYRKTSIEQVAVNTAQLLDDRRFILGLITLPVLWVAFYAMTGAYQNVFRRSRLKELGQTIYHWMILFLLTVHTTCRSSPFSSCMLSSLFFSG